MSSSTSTTLSDDTLIVIGSALKAGALRQTSALHRYWLVDTLDGYIPEPVRDVDQAFLMPIEDVFSISGPLYCLATGRI